MHHVWPKVAVLFGILLLSLSCGGADEDGTVTIDCGISYPLADYAIYQDGYLRLQVGTPYSVRPEITGAVTAVSFFQQQDDAPALPQGLVLDPATGEIAGVPAATALPAFYGITATCGGGGKVNTSVPIEVSL